MSNHYEVFGFRIDKKDKQYIDKIKKMARKRNQSIRLFMMDIIKYYFLTDPMLKIYKSSEVRK